MQPFASTPDKTSNEKSLNERKEKLEASDAAASGTGAPPKQGLPSNLIRALERPEDKRSSEQVALVRDYFEYSSPKLFPARLEITKLETNRSFLKGAVAEVMITESVKPRETRILPRGNWMDDSGPVVEPAIPEFLGHLDTGGRRANRLDLANWLVSPKNPLTARVYMNRTWSDFLAPASRKRWKTWGRKVNGRLIRNCSIG